MLRCRKYITTNITVQEAYLASRTVKNSFFNYVFSLIDMIYGLANCDCIFAP